MNEDIAQLKNQLRAIQSQLQILESRARQTWTLPVVPEPVKAKLQVSVKQIANGFAIGDVLRIEGTSWVKAKADNAANSVVVGVVIVTIGEDDFVVSMPGSYVTGLSGLTAGEVYYLSDTVAGGVTTTKPTIAVPVIATDSETSGYLLAGGAGSSIPQPTAPGQAYSSPVGGTGGWYDYLILGSENPADGSVGNLTVRAPTGKLAVNLNTRPLFEMVGATTGPTFEIKNTSRNASLYVNPETLPLNTQVTFRVVSVCSSGTTKQVVILSSDA
jgi:hypothetical protein